MYQEIPIEKISFTLRNPRSDPDADIDGLAASLGDEDSPRLAQFPMVEQIGPDEYRVIAGERRIRAAKLRGWQRIPCIVASNLDPVDAHNLRLVENLHRRDLHPLDQATALKIAWLSANADAIGAGPDARRILSADTTNTETLDALQAMLTEQGWHVNAPAVSWDAILEQMGLAINPNTRKKLLGVLTVDSSVQEAVKALPVTVSEAGLRAIGRLDTSDQQRLVHELAENPELEHRIRRIARTVHDGTRTLDEALAEARGETSVIEQGNEPGDSPEEENLPNAAESNLPPSVDDQVMQSVVALLEMANKLNESINDLKGKITGEGLAGLPAPWDEYAAQAVQIVYGALKNLEGGE